jgi:hypothetical protein
MGGLVTRSSFSVEDCNVSKHFCAHPYV